MLARSHLEISAGGERRVRARQEAVMARLMLHVC